jgi:hypothetical protein
MDARDAIIAADDAYVQDAIAGASWERRGPLRRLVRTDVAPLWRRALDLIGVR